MTEGGASAPRGREALGCALLLAAIAPFAHADAWLGNFSADLHAWLYVGGRMESGALPYRDLFDNKLPPVFHVCRAAMATAHPKIALAALDTVLAVAVGLAVAWFVRRTSGRLAAALAGVVAVLVSGHPRFHAGGGSTENFAAPLLAVSMVLVAGATPARFLGRAFAAGLLLALAAGFRPPALLCGAAFVPAAAGVSRSGEPRRPLARAVLAGGLGGLAGLLLVLAHPIARGYLADTFDACIGWNLRYAASTPSGAENVAYRGSYHVAVHLPLWVCAGVAVAGLARTAGRTRERWTLAVWWVASFLQCRVGGHDWPQHHVLTFAPLAALAVVGAADVVAAVRGSRGGRVASFAAAAGLAGWFAFALVPPLVPPLRAARDAPIGGRPPHGCEEAVAYLASRVPPDECVLAWTDLDLNELSWRLKRPGPSRHYLAPIYPKLGALDAELGTWRDDVLRARTRYAVVSGRLEAAVLGETERARGLVPAVADVARFLAENYRREATFGRFTILRRAD